MIKFWHGDYGRFPLSVFLYFECGIKLHPAEWFGDDKAEFLCKLLFDLVCLHQHECRLLCASHQEVSWYQHISMDTSLAMTCGRKQGMCLDFSLTSPALDGLVRRTEYGRTTKGDSYGLL